MPRFIAAKRIAAARRTPPKRQDQDQRQKQKYNRSETTAADTAPADGLCVLVIRLQRNCTGRGSCIYTTQHENGVSGTKAFHRHHAEHPVSAAGYILSGYLVYRFRRCPGFFLRTALCQKHCRIRTCQSDKESGRCGVCCADCSWVCFAVPAGLGSVAPSSV